MADSVMAGVPFMLGSDGKLHSVPTSPVLERGTIVHAYGAYMCYSKFAILENNVCIALRRPEDVDKYTLEGYFATPRHTLDKYTRPISDKFGIGFYYDLDAPKATEEELTAALEAEEVFYQVKTAEERRKKNAWEEAKTEARKRYGELLTEVNGKHFWDKDGKKVIKNNLRILLKKEFPGVKFSIRNPHSDTIHVTIPAGSNVNRHDVDKVAGLFQGKGFNGMEDYEYSISTVFNTLYGAAGYVFVDNAY